MPIYEYECEKCGNTSEQISRSIKEGHSQEFNCSECGGACKRLISKSRFYLKGSCWSIDGFTRNPEHEESVKTQKPHWDEFKKNRGI